MEQNKIRTYLLYAVGEILLVVIGIFIALQLNVWKENYELNAVKQNYYSQLIEDLNKDKKYAEEYIRNMELLKEDYKQYKDSFQGPSMTLEEAFADIRELDLLGIVISFNTSTIESLEKTGDIKLLPQEIRNRLLDLKREQDLLTERVLNNSLFQVEFIKEINLALGSPDLPERLINQPELAQVLDDRISFSRAFLALESTMNWKISTGKSSDFGDILVDITELTELIKNEVRK